MNASSPPAASGPRTVAAEKLACICPFAATSLSRSTRLGIAANCAAWKKMPRVDAAKMRWESDQTDSRHARARDLEPQQRHRELRDRAAEIRDGLAGPELPEVGAHRDAAYRESCAYFRRARHARPLSRAARRPFHLRAARALRHPVGGDRRRRARRGRALVRRAFGLRRRGVARAPRG